MLHMFQIKIVSDRNMNTSSYLNKQKLSDNNDPILSHVSPLWKSSFEGLRDNKQEQSPRGVLRKRCSENMHMAIYVIF